MRSWFAPPRRTARRSVEASPQQLVATGATGAGWDPVDGEAGWRRADGTGRAMPEWTLERARQFSIAGYRSNPMAKAIIDTYISFCVGDAGVSFQVTNPQVRVVVEEFWNDPRNLIGQGQELGLRSCLLHGETLRELMVGPRSGVVRYSPLDPSAINEVQLYRGNPLWPETVVIGSGDSQRRLRVASVDDATGLRDAPLGAGGGAATSGCLFWTPFKTVETDVRSMPFLTPVLDWLDNYDTVLSNLIDRTALARYLVWDVTVEGGDDAVNNFIAQRGGTHVPRSGTVEVHNQSVKWEAKTAETGAEEDSVAARSVLTLVAGGSGLARTWLADPEDANRATSLTMAEPVRRRVQGVQKVWLGYQTEFTRFAVDRAVAAARLPRMVDATDPRTGQSYEIPAAQSVLVTGPEIAAADAQITAQVLLNLSTGLEKLRAIGALSAEASAVAARKAWEDFVGIPYNADLDSPEANADDLATAIDDSKATPSPRLAVVNGDGK
ncbi:hypothetical protein [Nonomuraea sp. NPDC050202]|uniref:hypothetical protein n=1 Tax=Nonomuraea sp. NPDC050202 TaxID=3155035 RepID=UPI0034100F28